MPLAARVVLRASAPQSGIIQADLSNYDDEAAGGSAWPCAIDDFVEAVLADGEAPPPGE